MGWMTWISEIRRHSVFNTGLYWASYVGDDVGADEGFVGVDVGELDGSEVG